MASFTGAVVVSSAILIIAGIEDGEILADRMGRFFCLRPGNRLITRHSLLLVDVRLDQARIDGKRLAADQSGRNAHTHYTLEDPPQGVTLAEAFLSRTAEHGMVRYLVFDPELAEPAIGQVHLYLGANPSL